MQYGTFVKLSVFALLLSQLCSCNRGPKMLHLKEFMVFDSSLISQKVISIRDLPHHFDNELVTADSNVYVYCAFVDTAIQNIKKMTQVVAPGDSVYKKPFSDTIFFITRKRGLVHYLIWNKKKTFDIPRDSSSIITTPWYKRKG